MPIYISARLQNQVLDALNSTSVPLTTADVSNIIGKSAQATRTALIASGAIKIDNSYPIMWTAPNRNKIRKAPSQFDDVELTVGAKDVDDLLNMWNEHHEALGESIKSLEITPDSTVSAIAEQLGTIAGSIAHLAWQLSDVAGKPDWYEILTESE